MLKALRHALRLLRKTPGFSLIAISSLALGIGATSAMFSFSDALLLRPLPVMEPTRLVAISMTNSGAFGTKTALSYPNYRDYRNLTNSFDGMAASGYTSFGSAQTRARPRKSRLAASFRATSLTFWVCALTGGEAFEPPKMKQ